MTDVLKKENWTGSTRPQSLHYFCGPLAGPPEPPLGDSNYPHAKKAEVKTEAILWLNEQMEHLWPAGATEGSFDYNLLFDPEQRKTGPERFDSQYWRANVDPSER